MKKERNGSWIGRITWINGAFLFVVFLAGNMIAEQTALTNLVTYAPGAIWMIPGCILTLAGVFRRNRRWLLPNLVTATFLAWLLMGVNIPWRADRSGDAGAFTLMTFNMLGGKGGVDRVLEVIQRADPDIICIQEASVFGLPNYPDSEIPGYHIINQGGLVVASKVIPVAQKRLKMLEGYPDGLEVEFANGLKVVCVHQSFFTIEPVRQQSLWSVPGHMQQIALQHQEEANRFISQYSQSTGVVLAGDFNMPPRGRAYRTLSRFFDDAFAVAGWGTGYTWPSEFPIQRIDFAFVKGVRVLSAETIPTTVSNHLPVVFRMKLPART